MLFDKKVKVVTRLKNGDNLAISKLVDLYSTKGNVVDIRLMGDGRVEIKFVIRRWNIEKFEERLRIMRVIDGVEGRIEA